jgi:hypothetical protein
LNTLDGPLTIGRRYYGLMRLGLMGIAIQRPTLLDKLAKNGILLVLLSDFNVIRDGCFRAVFIVILKDLVSFRRRTRVLLKRRAIKARLYPLLIVGFDLKLMTMSSWYLYKILRQLMLQKALLRIYEREVLCTFNGPHIRLI